ncbi:UDPGP type 1 family protein [Coprococcus sp. AF16-5]|uniref:UDPGP type 1 family protein n=1 Tax=Coprococcus sp. AF16-5 TaxID=2293088 RepID=UPI000E48EC94|nr:UDPGP type 1 family protein [Coprococcus sp. AF16-5]RHR67124.1 UDPGP type 1 family protein [Coprococcus sp. AF16-5]
MNYENAYKLLEEKGQLHLLKYYDTLSEAEQAALLNQISEIDFSLIDMIGHNSSGSDSDIAPVAALQMDSIAEKYDIYKNAGLEAIKAGDLALVLLAGGQGTRLGFSGPKGTFNVGVTKDMFIFQLLIEHTLDIVKMADTWIHFFIMTNEKNHDDTTSFFKEHDYFGYNPEYVHFFKQEMVPSVDFNGKIYLEEKGKVAMSPNGNGGWFSSLCKAGHLDKLTKYGIKYINVFSVDNVLQRIADPVFLGAVLTKGFLSGGKVVKKAYPDEKVGVLCTNHGKPYIVEYYELTDAMRDERDANGDYAYNYGVTLNYIFPVDRLMKIMNESMPLHIVKKAIPYVGEDGEIVKPSEPNGYKFETLALDMIAYMGTCLPFEVDREKEFAPIKNATGNDSIDSARELLKKNGYTL